MIGDGEMKSSRSLDESARPAGTSGGGGGDEQRVKRSACTKVPSASLND